MALTHELLAIIPSGSPEAQDMAISKIKEAVSRAGGEPVGIKVLGEKRLAYPIKKHHTGVYILFNLSLPPQGVKKINDAFILMPEVVRAMIVKKSEVKPVPTVAAASETPEVKTKKIDLELGL